MNEMSKRNMLLNSSASLVFRVGLVAEMQDLLLSLRHPKGVHIHDLPVIEDELRHRQPRRLAPNLLSELEALHDGKVSGD